MLMVPAREDRIARKACEVYFGDTYVQNVTGVLHRSELNYDSLLEDFLQYDRVHVPAPTGMDKRILEMAVQSVMDDLRVEETVSIMTFEEVGKLSDFPGSRSPGLPYKITGP